MLNFLFLSNNLFYPNGCSAMVFFLFLLSIYCHFQWFNFLASRIPLLYLLFSYLTLAALSRLVLLIASAFVFVWVDFYNRILK